MRVQLLFVPGGDVLVHWSISSLGFRTGEQDTHAAPLGLKAVVLPYLLYTCRPSGAMGWSGCTVYMQN